MFKRYVPKKGTVIAILTALTVTILSVTSAFAAGGSTNPPTTAASTQVSPQTLEANWKVELARFQFDATFLDRVDRFLDRFESRSEKAKVGQEWNEKNDKREEPKAFVDASVILAKAQAIISSHAGFDTSGKVTDQNQAVTSMNQLVMLLNQFRADLLYKLRSLLHS